MQDRHKQVLELEIILFGDDTVPQHSHSRVARSDVSSKPLPKQVENIFF